MCTGDVANKFTDITTNYKRNMTVMIKKEHALFSVQIIKSEKWSARNI